jgi:uncharacterized protein (TIGR02679 family)
MRELPEGLTQWVGMPGPAAVLDAVRTRARRGFHTEQGRLSTLVLGAEQRREVGRLLGVSWEISGRPVSLSDLAARLAEHGLTVRALAEAVHGERIEEDRRLRARAAAAAAAERAEAAALITAQGVDDSHVEGWLADPSLPRAGGGDLLELVTQVADIWISLTRIQQPIRLAQLAAGTRGDAHELDADQPLGRAVARLAAIVHGLERPQRAGRTWRAAWAAVGIRCDGVSSRVLTLNLPLSGTSHAARLCRASAGEPVWLTLRSLAEEWMVSAGVTVFVCENPTIVETAADELGPSCPPLVCTDGIASGAALDLIAGLARAGCPLNVRADIDPAGFTVVDQVHSVAPNIRLWRFDVRTYAEMHDLPPCHASSDDVGLELTRLREAHDRHRLPLHEERLLDSLLADLRTAFRAGSCPKW